MTTGTTTIRTFTFTEEEINKAIASINSCLRLAIDASREGKDEDALRWTAAETQGAQVLRKLGLNVKIDVKSGCEYRLMN